MISGDSEPGRARGLFWSLLPLMLLSANIAGVAVLVALATGDSSHHVVSDYYRRAVNHEREMEQDRASLALDWRIGLELRSLKSEESTRNGASTESILTVSVRDSQQRPVDLANVRVEAFALSRAGRRVMLVLDVDGSGRYSKRVRLIPAGRWRFEIKVHRGSDRFRTSVDRDVGIVASPEQ